MPADMAHLLRRHLTYYCVVAVPRPLQAVVGKEKLVETLQTRDVVEARRRRHGVVAKFNALIEAARMGPAPPAPFDPATEGMGYRDYLTQGDGTGEDDHNRSIVMSDRADQIAETHGDEAAGAFMLAALGETLPIGFHVETWLAEASYPPRSQVQHRGTMLELERFCGAAKVSADVRSITRKVAGEWLTAAVKRGEKKATIARKLSTLRSYWRWLAGRDYAAVNPWAGIKPQKSRLPDADNDARGFHDAELLALLNGPADPVLADFIRLGALTGARLESLARLKVGDCSEGVFFIRKDKSGSGRRRVPIHSALAALVASRCEGKAPGDWLFAELATNKHGDRSPVISKSFARYRLKLGIDDVPEGGTRSRVTYHSLRHWLITAAIRADRAQFPAVQQIVGHKPQGVTMGTYFGGFTMEALRKCIESVRLPGAPCNPASEALQLALQSPPA